MIECTIPHSAVDAKVCTAVRTPSARTKMQYWFLKAGDYEIYIWSYNFFDVSPVTTSERKEKKKRNKEQLKNLVSYQYFFPIALQMK